MKKQYKLQDPEYKSKDDSELIEIRDNKESFLIDIKKATYELHRRSTKTQNTSKWLAIVILILTIFTIFWQVTTHFKLF